MATPSTIDLIEHPSDALSGDTEIGRFLGRGSAGLSVGCSGSRDITMVFATKEIDQNFKI
jgi:hypothetical protein